MIKNPNVDKMRKSTSKFWNAIKSPFNKGYGYAVKHPFSFFLVLMAALLALIITSSIINKPKPAPEAAKPPVRQVEVYAPGVMPKVTTNGSIKKDGVVEIIAQTNGIVNSIYKIDGQKITKGQTILNIATNYNGANLSSVSRQISERAYTNAKDTYNDRLKVIQKSIDIAEDSHDRSEDLRQINKDSIGRTEDIIDLNEEVIDSIDNAISNTNDNAQITQLKAQKAGLLSALNQLKSSLDTSQKDTKDDSKDEKISDNTRDIAVKNLELEKKALALNLETSKLQLQIARISESFNFPASPITGTVEKIFVKNGDTINPGTKLAVVKSNTQSAKLEIYISKSIAENLDKNAMHKLYFDTNPIDAKIKSVSSEAVTDSMYSVIFEVPANTISKVYNNESIKADLFVVRTSAGSHPLVPIDAVFQTQSDSSVRTLTKVDANNDKKAHYKVESKVVTPGKMFGSYIEILNGLSGDDEIVLDRNVSVGQVVVKK